MKVLIIGAGGDLGALGVGKVMLGGVVVGTISDVELSVDMPEELPPFPTDFSRPMRATFSLEYKGTKVKRGKGKKARW